MAQRNINEFNTPDVIRNLPEFHGDYKTIQNFIRTVNPVAELVAQAPEFAQPFWFTAIRNKIQGAASERLRLYGEPETWAGIRTCLLLHFSDHRDQRSLYNQLNSLKQTHSVTSFYDQILELVTALNQKVMNSNHPAAIKQAEIERNLVEGLQIFISGVHEPLRTILFSRAPGALNDAFAIAMQLQFDNKKQFSYQSTNTNSRYVQNQSQLHFQPRIRQVNNYQQRPVVNNNNYNRNNSFRGTSQQNSRFGPNVRNPTPMDVDRSTQNRRQNLQPNQSRRFVAEELFSNENFRNTRPREPRR